MVNNMMEMLADVPPMLAAAWLAWFVAGGMLAAWYRRASLELEFAPAAPRPVAKPKPAPRPSADVRRETAPVVPEAPVEAAAPQSYELPPALEPVAPREIKPVVIGDPFGDLATLLDQAAESQAAKAAPAPPAVPAPHRAPSESPILSSTGFPMRRDDEPKLG